MYNEGKTIKNIEGKFESPEHKRIFNEMTEAGFKEALDKSRKLKTEEFLKNNPKNYSNSQDNSGVINPRSHGKYGGMLNAKGLQNIDNKEHRRLGRQDEEEHGTFVTGNDI